MNKLFLHGFWRDDIETACDTLELEFNRQALIVNACVMINQYCKEFNDEYKDVDENNLGWLDRSYRFGKMFYIFSVISWQVDFIQRLERAAACEEKLCTTVNVILAHETEEIRNKEYGSLFLVQPQKIEKSAE